MSWKLLTVATFAAGSAWLAPQAAADAVEDFYRGNTIRLYVSASAGGTYDLAARVFARHFPNHVPGKPTVIVINQPGTIGLPNWLQSVAEKDGTIIALPNLSVPMNQVVMPKNVRYDVTTFNWIGNLEGSTGIIFTYQTSPTKTFQDALKRETPTGVPSRSGTAYQLLAMSNRMLNTKFRIIAGYERNRVIAMESGELEGTATNIENMAGLAPHWLPKNLVNVLVVHASQRVPRLPKAPTMLELTGNKDHRQILETTLLQSATARAIVAPPGVPPERVQALRRAFDRTAKDPAFLSDAAKALLDIGATTGEETQRAVARLIATPPEVVARVLEAIK